MSTWSAVFSAAMQNLKKYVLLALKIIHFNRIVCLWMLTGVSLPTFLVELMFHSAQGGECDVMWWVTSSTRWTPWGVVTSCYPAWESATRDDAWGELGEEFSQTLLTPPFYSLIHLVKTFFLIFISRFPMKISF